MAKQDGSWVNVYDENNRQLYTKRGELHGYTSSTVTIKQGNWLEMFDERGNNKGSRRVS